MAVTVARLEAILEARTEQYTRKMKEADAQTKGFGKTLNVMKTAAIGGAVVGVAVLAEGLKKSVEAGLEAQKTQARLVQAFKAAGLSAAKYEERIKEQEKASRILGFTNDDVRQSLGSLITATGNYETATKRLGIAQDLARYKGVSLEQATKALTMASAGSTRFLKQLGILTPTITSAQEKAKVAYDKAKEAIKEHYQAMGKLTDAQKAQEAQDLLNLKSNYDLTLAVAKTKDKHDTLAKAIEIVTQKVHGQSEAFHKTAQGGMAEFHAQIAAIEENIGKKLIPQLTKLVASLNTTLLAFENNWNAIKAKVVPILNLIVATVRGMWNQIASIFSFWGDVIHLRFSKFGDDLKRIVLSWVDPLKIDSRKNAVAIYEGFRDGLTDQAKKLEAFIKGFFGKVIKWAKGTLGVGSPSTIFHGIGQDLIRGFINGVGSMAGELKSAVVHIAEHYATAPFRAAGSLLGGGGGTARGGTGAALARRGDAIIGNKGPVVQQVADAVGYAASHGWHGSVTSGYRTYAQQAALYQLYLQGGPLAARPGTSSHERGQAVDVTNPAAFAAAMATAPAYARLFNRLGSADPVHFSVSGYDRGGWLMPGATLAFNATGRPERVVSGNGDQAVFHVNVGGEHLATIVWDELRRMAKVFERTNGRPPFGGGT